MKNTDRKKLLGLGILVGLVVIFFILNPFHWPLSKLVGTKDNIDLQKNLQKQSPVGEPQAITSPSKDSNKDTKVLPIVPSDKDAKSIPPATDSHLPSGSLTVPSIPAGMTPALPQLKADVAEAKKPPAITDGCFNLTFTHKKLASHEDGEACLLHKNLIVLSHSDQATKSKINPKSVCMRINGKAVKYSFIPGKLNQVLIGPEAGPNAKITASYCVGKAKCSTSCIPEKDQFLSAIGADEGSDPTQTTGWDGHKGKTAEDTEAENQMTALNQEIQSDGGDNSQIFSGWILESQTARCEQTKSNNHKVAEAK